MGKRKDLHDRFWSKVEKRGPDECWPWLAAIGTHGYGVIGKGRGTITAHRLAFEIAHGTIPDAPGAHGGVVMHTCDNRWCCNPAHLTAGTQGDNLRDMATKGRAHKEGMDPSDARTAKLAWGQVDEIRVMFHEKGVARAELARIFRVLPQTIWQIVTNRTWKQRRK